MVRGGTCASVKGPTCPTPQPAVSSADFSALYELCLAKGLKARLVFNHAAGLQVVTVSCSLPRTSTIPATAGKRHHRRRRRRGEKCKNLQETRLFIRGFYSHATVLTNTKQLPIGQWLNASGVHLVN